MTETKTNSPVSPAPTPDAGQGTGERLFEELTSLLLDQPWHERCAIITDYMPPFPRSDTRPRTVVKFNDGTEHPPFLRHSCGPKQGFFWDIYGDDMQSIPLAILALSRAPYPRDVGPLVFRIPLPPRVAVQSIEPDGHTPSSSQGEKGEKSNVKT